MAFRKHASQDDIFVADIGENSELSRPQRLTLAERHEYAVAWTADSKAVVFYSNRNGPFHVLQNINFPQFVYTNGLQEI
jgi:hypothetical protein